MSIAETFPVEQWIRTEETVREGDAAYWNDAASESKKVWADEKNGFARTKELIETQGAGEHLRWARDLVRARLDRSALRGLDLACGTCWAVPILLEEGFVSHLTCVDFSRPRIFDTAPRYLAHAGVPPARVSLCWGTLGEIHRPDASFDLIHLAQGVHCAENHEQLFREIRRLLAPGGVLLIVADPFSGRRTSFRNVVRTAVRGASAFARDASGARVLPPFLYRVWMRMRGFRVVSRIDKAKRKQSHVGFLS